MSKPSKDTPEIVKFMTLFARLKLYSDDAPEDLSELAANDSSVKDVCIQLSLAAHFLQVNERRARALFAAPVDPTFLAAWRDYEERFETIVSGVFLSDLLPELGTAEHSRGPKADSLWDNADDEAAEQASGIHAVLSRARTEVQDELLDDEEFLQVLDDGLSAWDRLVKEHGLDLRGVFRRRALVPFVLVPRKIAAKHGSAEKLSMLKNLQQAHDAFVFGATYAALAMMRSIMESVLRDHYHVKGGNLEQRIDAAGGLLPRGANKAALHRLRKRANTILHLNLKEHEKLPKLDQVKLEKEIVSLLFVLRALIEGAK